MPKKKSGPNKSDFVRSQPQDLPAADVVAKAKEAGMTMTTNLVYNVRAALKGKGTKPKKAPANHAPATAKAAAKATGDKLSASAFIRSLPNTMTVKEVAEKAAAAGYVFKPNYVYDVRNAEKKRAAKAARSGSSPKPEATMKPATASKPTAHAAGSSSQLAQFRNLMIDLGLTQAEAVYSEVHRMLKAIKAGG